MVPGPRHVYAQAALSLRSRSRNSEPVGFGRISLLRRDSRCRQSKGRSLHGSRGVNARQLRREFASIAKATAAGPVFDEQLR